MKNFTPRQVAEILNYNEEVIRRKIRNKEIEAFRVGRKWLVKEETLKAIMEG